MPQFLSILVLAFLATSGSAWALGPEQIHLSWQNDPKTTMTVQWADDPAAAKGVFEFGLDSGNYTESVPAEIGDYPEYASDETAATKRTFFVAEATDLQPGTLYYYRVGDGTNFSEERTFKTAIPESDNAATFRFIAMGDSRGGPDTSGGGYQTFGKAINDMILDTPDFFIFSGDAVDVASEEEWNNWFLAGENAMSTIPLMPTYGNHEGLNVNYAGRFALPQNGAEGENPEYHYTFEYGNARFIVLNDNYLFVNESTRLDGPQYEWFEHQLATNDKEWLFVMNHQAFFSASNHGSEPNLQDHWLPLIDKYHVDMVFNGHDHNYERSKPIFERQVASSMNEGTVFVVAAAIGAPLYDSGTEWHTAISEKTSSYAIIDIDGRTMTYTAKRLDGSVIDEFTFTKEPRKFKPKAVSTVVRSSCSTSGGAPLGLMMMLLPVYLVRRYANARPG